MLMGLSYQHYYLFIVVAFFIVFFKKIFDCDFNQQLGIAVGGSDLYVGGKTVFDISKLSDLKSDTIRTDNHCFGCTAGFGSSCQGATVEA